MNEYVMYVCMLILVVLFHLMLAWLYANVSFTLFVLQWVTSSMSHSLPLFSRQITYEDDDWF